MSNASHDLVLFLGRFHPLLVHLPIGGLVLLGLLELLAKAPRFKDAAQNRRLILGLTAGASVAAALAGWLLSQAGGYEADLLPWHKWSGLGAAAGCAITFLLCRPGRPGVYQVSLWATLAVLVAASHWGASLTHGRDYLTGYAPGPLRGMFAGKSGGAAAESSSHSAGQRPVFAEVVQPILLQRCSGCHGPEKQRGELRVDSREALLKGGSSGPAVVAGRAWESRLIQRLLLPITHEDHMPPEGRPQPSLAEIVALEWWIDQGAPADGQPARRHGNGP